MLRKNDAKAFAEIISEWDTLAPVRYRQITSGEDVTYSRVLVPNVLSLLAGQKIKTVVDAGCGVGCLTGLLADYANEVIGVDPSAQSIKMARIHFGEGVRYFVETLEDYSKKFSQSGDLVIANMVLMDVLDLNSFLAAVRNVLRPNGRFIFSTTHPCFWPRYYGYADEPWFKYDQEIIIEGSFKISSEPDCPLQSTHVHRPLSKYMRALRNAGLLVEKLDEPLPSVEVEAFYPAPWAYPRYLVGLCRRQKVG